ncbi:efflux pump [Hypoxylon sp. NC1633]|nr:efflux pump [Hypoxylon sp. NC1633]
MVEFKQATEPISVEMASKGSENNDTTPRTTPHFQAGEPDVKYLSGLKLTAVLTGIILVSFIMLLDMTIIVTAIPKITDEFSSLPDIGWYGSAYTLASAVLQPGTGRLYSHLNTKWTFLVFVAILEVGSLVCALASSSGIFILGRVIAGLGASGILNGSLTIIAASVPLVRRPAITGVVIGLAYMGSVAGPLIGGAFTEFVTWRWCFWVNLPIGCVAVGILLFAPIPKHSSSHINISSLLRLLDITGFFLLGIAVTMILLALHFGGNIFRWDSPLVIGLLCGGFAASVAFIYWERRLRDNAMIPLSLISRRVVWSSCIVSAFMTSTLLVHSYYLPIYFQAVRDVSPALSGVYLLPSILSQLASSALSGFIVSKIGYCLPPLLASGVVVAIGSGILSLLNPTTATATWVGYQILLGFGRGIGIQVPIIAVQADLASDMVPIGMSLVVFSQTFGGSVFLTVANLVFQEELRGSISRLTTESLADRVIDTGATAFRSVVPEEYIERVLKGYSEALSAVFYLSAALSLVYFVISWGIGRTSLRDKRTESQ